MSRHNPPEPISGAEIVHRHWPLDGPYTTESVVAATDAIGELNRYLAHATLVSARAVFPQVPDGYPIFGHLAYAAHTQGEVLQNLARWADGLVDEPGLHHDEYRAAEPALSAEAAQDAALDAARDLRHAAAIAGQLGNWLSRVSGTTSHLYHDLDWGLDR